MILVVLILACTTTLAGGFIVGYVLGRVHAQALRDADRPAPHEALRLLLTPGQFRPIPEAQGDWWGV